jgi:hypothetical protein
MKKQFSLIPTILIFAILFISCKKETASDSNKPKDYAASIVNKTWWGTFAYKNQTDEYYSMYFNADNTLEWDQFLGKFKGFWVLDSNRLTITFEGNDTKITAKIGEDSTLSHFSDNTDFSEIKSGQMVGNPKITLDNTTWEGKFKHLEDSISVKLEFKEKSQFLGTFMSTQFIVSDYSSSSSGGALRLSLGGRDVFLVIVSNTDMYGTIISYIYPIHLTKQ